MLAGDMKNRYGNHGYQTALEDASKELKSLDEMVCTLECQRARLRQAIAILQTLLGHPISKNQTQTDAIIDFLRAKDGYAATADVIEGLISRGYSAQPRSVATILCKLVREKQLKKGPKGGYKWTGIPESDGRDQSRSSQVDFALDGEAGCRFPACQTPSRSAKNKS